MATELGGSLRQGSGSPTDVPSTSAASKECISVVARIRPSANPSDYVRLKEGELEVAVPRGDDIINNQIESYHFKFAKVYGPQTTQGQIFDGIAKDLIFGALDGVNCTIFAYGQTGSGKTHTICGDHRDRGIIPRAMACVFDAIDHRHDNADYSVSMSFIEVYKEVGYDLLAKEFGKMQDSWPVVSVSLQSGEPVLQGAKRVAISSEEEGLHQYFLGDTHRTVAETPHNLNSSRSHCIFTIFIEASVPATQTVRTSKVQIVDLAGSERLKPYEAGSQNDKVLMGQAVSINLSLHWLEGVINALNKNNAMVPYRNSFLTKVLKDALGGNAKAVMVATVNPADAAMPETISTCRFAMRVANVQTFAKVNEERDPQLVIAALRQENAELRAALAASGGGAAGDGGEAEVSDEELRVRARAFLEDESGGGTTGGAALTVRSLLEAFAAFRILRELFWEMLRRRVGGVGASESTDADSRRASPLPRQARNPLDDAAATTGGDTSAGDSLEALKRALQDRDGECRMLRAALAAQPPRPAARPVRAQVRPRSAFASTQTDASLRRMAKPKRPTSASADARPKGMRGFIGFSQEDVVDPFGRLENKTTTLPPIAPRMTDSRVPDFRQMAKEQEEEEAEEDDESDYEPQEVGRQSSRSEPVITGNAPASSSKSIPRPPEAAPAAATEAPATQRPPGGASAAWLSATTALAESELAMMGSKAKAYKVFLLHDPRAADIWPSELTALRQDRKERMEEARALGEEIDRTKDATRKVQQALESLQDKLRQAEAEASVDTAAAQRAEMLKGLLATEEPRLVQLFDEKRQRYELDFSRLKELRREISLLEHGQKKLETTVQSEFEQWRRAVAERYPEAVQAAQAAESSAAALEPALASGSSPISSAAAASEPLPATTPDAPEEPPSDAKPTPAPNAALVAAEAALSALRQRLEEAKSSGDERRMAMLEQILASEEPRIAKLRAEQGLA